MKEKYTECLQTYGLNINNHQYREEILEDLDSRIYKYVYDNLFKEIIKLILKSKEK